MNTTPTTPPPPMLIERCADKQEDAYRSWATSKAYEGTVLAYGDVTAGEGFAAGYRAALAVLAEALVVDDALVEAARLAVAVCSCDVSDTRMCTFCDQGQGCRSVARAALLAAFTRMKGE